jgi:hypothetical protein
MLSILLAPPSYNVAAPTAGAASRGRRASAVRCAADEFSVLAQFSESFWSSKRAQMRAEMEGKLREMEEFQAREAALYETLSTRAVGSAGGGVAPALAGGAAAPAAADGLAQIEALMRELTAEKAKSAALEEELAAAAMKHELELQRTGAFWIEKLAAARSGEGEAGGAVAAAPAAPAAPAEEAPLVDPTLTLRELRSRLLSHGLSTIGLKAELQQRLANAMLHERVKHKSWDPASQSWV